MSKYKLLFLFSGFVTSKIYIHTIKYKAIWYKNQNVNHSKSRTAVSSNERFLQLQNQKHNISYDIWIWSEVSYHALGIYTVSGKAVNILKHQEVQLIFTPLPLMQACKDRPQTARCTCATTIFRWMMILIG